MEPRGGIQRPAGEEIAAGSHVGDPNSLPGGKKFDGMFADDFARPDGVDAVGRELETGTLAYRLGDTQRGPRGCVALAGVMHLDDVDVVIAAEQPCRLGHEMNHHRDARRRVRGEHDRNRL